jgi:hypothetical protein
LWNFEEIEHISLFQADDGSSGITGECIDVDSRRLALDYNVPVVDWWGVVVSNTHELAVN